MAVKRKFEIDNKKAAFLGIGAIASVLVSYLVYKSVAETDESIKKRAAHDRKI